MARNLRSKIPQSDTLIICDANPKATQQFVQEQPSSLKVEVATSPQQVALESVWIYSIYIYLQIHISYLCTLCIRCCFFLSVSPLWVTIPFTMLLSILAF